RPLTFLVRKLLPRLDGEFEVRRRSFRPTFCRFRRAWPIESGIDFDGVEISRIELQFVGLRQRIEDTRPRSRPGAGRIAPTASTDSPYPCIILRFDEEIARCRFAVLLSCHSLSGIYRTDCSRRVTAEENKPRDHGDNGTASDRIGDKTATAP